MKLLDQGGLSHLIVKIKDLLNLKADIKDVQKIVSSPTEPSLKTGDIWHKEI